MSRMLARVLLLMEWRPPVSIRAGPTGTSHPSVQAAQPEIDARTPGPNRKVLAATVIEPRGFGQCGLQIEFSWIQCRYGLRAATHAVGGFVVQLTGPSKLARQ